MPLVEGIKQNTPEWEIERLGTISSTRAYNLMSSNITRRTLMAEIIRELVTADSKPKTNARVRNFERGHAAEAPGVASYSMVTGHEVTNTDSYFVADFHPLCADSPDGLVGEVGVYEGKRLDEENHIKLLLGAPHEKSYIEQCKWHLLVTGRQWCDLVYYCETLPPEIELIIHRIERDEREMEAYKDTALQFFDDLNTKLDELGLSHIL